MINFYNNELSTLSRVGDLNGKDVGDLIDNNPTKISWTRALKNDLKKGRDLEFDDLSIYVSMYRPFIKCWMYFNRRLNEMVYQMPQIFPFPNSENVLITLNVNPKKGFCVLLTDVVPDFHLLGDVRKRAARTVLTGMCYSVGSATRQGSSSLTRFIGQSAMTLRT
ncbi:Predicted helicase [Klebsiella pneumoniae]|nr:Predicted helicase [Klebsiella pneumoniae]